MPARVPLLARMRRRSPSRRREGAKTSWSRRACTWKSWAFRSGSFRRGPTASRRPGCSISSGCRARGSSWRGSAQARRVPVVLSPICWYEPRASGRTRTSPVRKLASLAAWGLRSLVPAVPSWRRELLRLADVVLPNSRSEANQLIRLFGVPRERIRVVPNGVLPSIASASPELFQRRWGAEPVRPFCRADRTAQEHSGADPGHARAGAAAGGDRRGPPGLRGL